MKVKVLHNFYDKTADLKLRQKDQIIEATKERADMLIAMKMAVSVVTPGKEK